MTAIALPASPGPIAPFSMEVARLSNDVTSLSGGNRQRNQRKGDHYRCSFAIEPMEPNEARSWRKLLTAAQTVSIEVPQPGFDVGAPGSPTVNGSLQLGATLNVTDLTPYYVVRQGQVFTILTNGRHWLYASDGEVVASAGGTASIPLEVMIRTLHANGDPIEFANPRIEGFPDVEPNVFEVQDDGYVWLRFDIEERG